MAACSRERRVRRNLAALSNMVGRFAASAAELVTALFPRYAPYVKRARTSFRPQPAVGRAVSWRKDDSRLHVDAFPSRPNHGERILRVFSNVKPGRRSRMARGRMFRDGGQNVSAANSWPIPGRADLSGIRARDEGSSQRIRSPDAGTSRPAKADLDYQKRCGQQVVHFAPGTTWFCFSDQVMHAAVSGQYMLEQTIHVPVSALYDPQSSPLAILERLCGRSLLPSR